jgi:molecular chaperone HscB
LQHLIDQEGHFSDAVAQVRALMFIERFARDVDSRLDAIES